MFNCSRLSASKWKFLSFVVASTAILGSGCRQKESEADVSYAVDRSPTPAEVSAALKSPVSFRVNLKTNRLTYFRQGKFKGQWNIVSADTTGEFHENRPKATPTGIFRADTLMACPQWAPFHPKNDNGVTAANDSERLEIFRKHPETYGACGNKNPLGMYAIWFQSGLYALHGNSAPWVLDLKADKRRASGGCIRNPNEKIDFVFHDILDAFPELSTFKSKVVRQDKNSGKKATLSEAVQNLPIFVVVGSWPSDPETI